jgi:hypothetical protein
LSGWRGYLSQGSSAKGRDECDQKKELSEADSNFINVHDLICTIFKSDGCTLSEAAIFLLRECFHEYDAQLDRAQNGYDVDQSYPFPQLFALGKGVSDLSNLEIYPLRSMLEYIAAHNEFAWNKDAIPF